MICQNKVTDSEKKCQTILMKLMQNFSMAFFVQYQGTLKSSSDVYLSNCEMKFFLGKKTKGWKMDSR